MDKRKSVLNVVVAVVFRIILLFLGILTTRFLIKYSGNEINGLNSLYKSIIGFLSVADLGVGTAINYCMYRPIVEGNDDLVAALFSLFKKINIVIGVVILLLGCGILPFLPFLTKQYSSNENLYLCFMIMLISVVLSYMFSAKTALINAYKNNYITTLISSMGMILQQVLQIIVLVCFESYKLYLFCRILGIVFQWYVTELWMRRDYKKILNNPSKLITSEIKSDVIKNVKAMCMHKIGGVLVNSVDSIIISVFCGLILLGKYSNYLSIMTSLISLLVLFFVPLTSIIGHVSAKQDKNLLLGYYDFFYGINYCLATVAFLIYYASIDTIIYLFYGADLEIGVSLKVMITTNYFIQFMRQSTLLFRDATGTFYYDRWKPILEGLSNLFLSLVFVNIFPQGYKIEGVLLATIITNLFICHVIEPYVLYKNVFRTSFKIHYVQNNILIMCFCILLYCFEKFRYICKSMLVEMIVNIIIAILFSLIAIIILLIINKNFRKKLRHLIRKIGLFCQED